MNLVYLNHIDEGSYNRLREEVSWGAISYEQAINSLSNSAYIISCMDDNHVVGTARVVWDKGYSAMICDVMVSPNYQRKGIGNTMLTKIMDYLNNQLKPGWKIMVILTAVYGKESFYEKFGFVPRPNDSLGAGMSQWIEYAEVGSGSYGR